MWRLRTLAHIPCIWPASARWTAWFSELWNLVQALPAYRGKTTLFVLPEFGRDFDGSSTNGFFNHRSIDDSTSLTWMMCLGEAVQTSGVVERPVQHIDICPTIAGLLGSSSLDLPGKPLPGLDMKLGTR